MTSRRSGPPGRARGGIRALLAEPESSRRLGPFSLVSPLGKGGFAPVWLAHEVYGATVLRSAAVKLFSVGDALSTSPGGDGGEQGRRIIDEARALCRVEHPNVVRFYALPIDDERGVMGLAMEHIAGTPLDVRLSQRGKLSAADALDVGLAIASALGATHRAGIVHRDVKPANIIDAGGVYKLIDFGIAAGESTNVAQAAAAVVSIDDLPVEVGGVGDTLGGLVIAQGDTLAGLLGGGAAGGSSGAVPAGTLGYIDPVCLAKGEPAVPASDMYALGATLFECLVGKVPAAVTANAGALRGEVLDGSERAPSLDERLAEAPPSFRALIDALLSPTRAERPSAEASLTLLQRARAELKGRRRSLPPEDVGPFRGLGRFEHGDRDLYFGRTTEIAASLEVLRGQGLLSLLGPSGSGKSSLARAGVLPALEEGALGGSPAEYDTVVVSPGHDPRGEIVRALAALGVEATGGPDALIEALCRRVEATGRGVALLVDQLEELTTLSSPEGRAFAAELLGRLGERPLPGVRALVAARRDLLDPLLALPGLGRALVRGTLLIEPMSELAWGEALRQALASYGYSMEDEALERELLDQLELSADAMPLIQFALTELWSRRDRARKQITREGVRALGGIAGALDRHAEHTVAPFVAAGRVEPLRALLVQLTTARGTRALRAEGELSEAAGSDATAMLGALEEARLLVRSREGVTLAHEALLQQWGRLRSWVAEAREDRLLLEELERDAERFERDPQGATLWKRQRLAHVRVVADRPDARPSARARSFIGACARAELRSRAVVAGLAALSVVVAVAGGAVYVRDTRAQQAATLAALDKAELRTREVQAAQARISELLKDLEASPKKDEIIALQAKIREADAASSAVAPTASAPRAPAAAVRPASAPSAASARPQPAQPAPAAKPAEVKPLTDW